MNRLFRSINIWVILVALLVTAGLVGLFWVLIFLLPPPASQPGVPQAALTVIVAPSPTATRPFVAGTATPTPPTTIEGISMGSYVQIAGTDGAGLRIRSGPGTSNPPRFLGMDAEVFLVKDGPKTSDGFTWWYLEAPYDPARSGWAASKYLKVVLPTPAPN